jgi:predicted phosphodiesterase
MATPILRAAYAVKTVQTVKHSCKIQYVSDLHLEFHDSLLFQRLLRPAANYLALAGDIGKPGHTLYDPFLKYASDNWDHVFYVAGNHEYYDTHRSKWGAAKPILFEHRHAEIVATVKQYPNIHFLRHESPSYYLAAENIAVVGSTLWTHTSDENRPYLAYSNYNDYNFIARAGEGGTIMPIHSEFLNAKHEAEKQMLEAQIAYWESQNTDVVVVTHHMPSFSLISPRYRGDPLNFCFASNCESLMRPNVKAWIYGHTHNASSGMLGQTFVACNAHGYPGESVPGFQTDRCLEIRPRDEEEAVDGLSPELVAAAHGIKNPEITQVNDDSTIVFV